MKELIKLENGDLLEKAKLNIALVEKEMKKLKEIQEEYKEELIKIMEENNLIKLDNDLFTISYVGATTKETFDSKTFREENEDLYNDYIKFSDVKSSIRIKLK